MKRKSTDETKGSTAQRRPQRRSADAAAKRDDAAVGPENAAVGRKGPHASVHRQVSNQAVQALHEQGNLQAKLDVSSPRDPAEREAERVAEEVMRMPERDGKKRGDGGPSVQRSASDGASGGAISGDAEARVRSSLGGGKPLPESTRSSFESRFERDFSDVRVHTGPGADRAARSIDAEAFTLGTDVAFARGNYRPETTSGRTLLAHELTHVVQQRGSAERVHRQSPDRDEDSDAEGGDDEREEDDVDARADAFVDDMNRRLDGIRRAYVAARDAERTAESAAGGDEGSSTEAEEPPTLAVQKGATDRPGSGKRTPEQQADSVIRGLSWTCGGAHIADNARHVFLTIGGTYVQNPEADLVEAFDGSVRDAFVDAWDEVMDDNELRNYKGELGWAPGDAYHLEMPDGRPDSRSDVVEACYREYVKRTRGEGADRNESFEEDHGDRIREIEEEIYGEARESVHGAVEQARDASSE